MEVLMPQLGETVAEGKVVKWFKAVGDRIAPGDNLCEIETDKVTVEVPAISAGVLSSINVGEGTVAPVGAVLAVVSDGARRRSRPLPRPPAARPLRQAQRRSGPPWPTSRRVLHRPRAPSTCSARCRPRCGISARPGPTASWSRRSPAGWLWRPVSTSRPSPAPAPMAGSPARTSRRRSERSPQHRRRSPAPRPSTR